MVFSSAEPTSRAKEWLMNAVGWICCFISISAFGVLDGPTPDGVGINAPVSIASTDTEPAATAVKSETVETPEPSMAASIPLEIPIPESVVTASERQPLGQRTQAQATETQSFVGSGQTTMEAVKTAGALSLVLGLIFILQYWLRKRSGGWATGARRPSGVLEVLARFPVGRQQTLVLLKMDRRVLLLHQSAGAMTTLAEVNDPHEVASLISRVEAGSKDRDSGDPFSRILGGWTAQHDAASRQGAAVGETIDLTRRRSRRLLPTEVA